MSNIKKILLEKLKSDERIWNSDKTELNQTLLLDLIENIDEIIIEILLQEKILREKFFINIKDVYVFKTNDFRFFIEENKIDNSYTSYKNRIGLTDGKRFIKDTDDVVLNFPYKDCVLEGGQSTEEGLDTYFEFSEKSKGYEVKQSKRKEVFFNQVLAYDEIDRLFDPKAFVNWKRFTKNGEEEVGEIKRDENGTIRENLIIKGNNLLALHSLKKQFSGKVKLIYIDPPYNTDSDANTFKYNNNFNHSTWLTFMKNRLEVAKQLLKDDGIVIIDIDHFELFYLGILCDEIFGKSNRLGILAVQHNPGGRDNEFFANSHENKLVYAKNKSLAKIYSLNLTEKEKNKYKKEDEYGKYFEMGLQRTGDGSKREDRPNLYFPIYYNEKTKSISLHMENGLIEILPIDDDGVKRRWRWGKEKIEKKWKKELIVKIIKGKYKVYTKKRLFVDTGRKPKTFWFDSQYAGTTGTNAIKEVFGDKVFTYPKSPYMVNDTLEIASKIGDIVLDYHLGSGTTAAVAQKMGRQYIGIEQMDYIHTVTCPRVQKVMVKENIDSSFIYFELAKWNETAKEIIVECKTYEELIKFFDEMYKIYFLNYNLKIKEFREKVVKEQEFITLSLDKQKKMFIAMLDNNQMYINKTEMADKKFGISKGDQTLTSQFYKT